MRRRATSTRQRAIALAAAPALLPPQQAGLWAPRGQYNAARTDRPNTRGWRTRPQSADADAIGDLPQLRARARDAARNMPLARSTLLTFQSCVIGTGLQPFPMIDTEFLGMTEAEGDALESQLMRHWMAWSRSPWSSFDLSMDFQTQQRLTLTARIVNGDHWVIVRRRQIPGTPYTLSLQHVEADLVSTPPDQLSNGRVIDGVELDENGVAVAIHVANHYPGDRTFAGSKEWVRVPIFADDAERTRLVWHCVDRDRVSQTRGVTQFAAGLEVLKGKSDFADNHLTAALNSTIFTVLFKSPRGTQLLPGMVAIDPVTKKPVVEVSEEGGPALPPPPPLGSGNAVSLFADESVEPIESKHPSPLFAPFNLELTKEWGASQGLPYELILRSFTSSFSASKGAVNEGWKTIRVTRTVEESCLARRTWRTFVADLVATGAVDMPGFFTDAMRREAFLAHEWTGPVPGHLNPAQEATAAEIRLRNFLTTHEEETAQLSGRIWEANHRQQAKEHRWQREALLRAPVAAAPAQSARVTPLTEAEAANDSDDDADEDGPSSTPGDTTPPAEEAP